VYQEAERLDRRAALMATLTNFVTRIVIVMSFVAIVLTLPKPYDGIVAFAWGCALLGAISYILARARGVGPALEVIKHLGVAALAIAASRVIGLWITNHVH
jgi:VIT1/CCC1 family predicted Fe2+/Mn2+ transporter